MGRNIKKCLWFLALTFAINWSMAITFFALGGRINSSWFLPMAVAYMFVPALAAVFVQKIIFAESVTKPLGISFRLNRWFLIAWLLPPLIALLTVLIAAALPDVSLTLEPETSRVFEHFSGTLSPDQIENMSAQLNKMPVHIFWVMLFGGLFAGITVNAIAGFGEELGWRGLMQKELSFLGFWKSSAVIGIIWGIWHAPIILMGHNYPEHPVAGLLMMTLLCLLLAPIFGYIRIRAKSVIAAAVIHGTFNATAGLSLILIKGGGDLTVGVTGLAGMTALSMVNLCIFIYEKYFAEVPVADYTFDTRL